MSKKSANRKINQNKLDDISNSIAVESLFSTYILLNTYLSSGIVRKAREIHLKKTNTRIQDGLLWGYKLLVVASLHSYIYGVVRSPEVLGIEADPDYYDYWVYTKGRGREITRSATRGNHYISRFVEKANLLISDLISLKSWDDIEGFGKRTNDFRNCLRTISEKAYMAFRNGKEVPIDKALLEASTEILWSTSGNPTPLAHIYADYFISHKKDDADLQLLEDMIEECNTTSGTTRLDYSRFSMFGMARPLPQHWALGYAFILHESLKQLACSHGQGTKLALMDNLVASIKNWRHVDSYSRKLTSVYGLPKPYSYSYARSSSITNEEREPLTTQTKSPISPERLLSIFGNRARIVERGSPGAYFNFSCLLDGAIKRSRETREKVKVALVVHKLERGRRHEDYSVAILMPAYGFISNASMWWVFYDIGNNHSGSASYAMKQVLTKIKRNKKSLDVMVIPADIGEFYEYCEDPGYVRLEKVIVLSNKVVSDIRGAFPELLLANLLTNMHYTKVLNRLKPKVLKTVKGELDVVGVKFAGEMPSHILIFESKGQAIDELELQQKINRFSQNISIVRRQLRAFCNELGLPYAETIEVKAVFVSMADLKTGMGEPVHSGLMYSFRKPEVKIPSGIELWDYNDFISKLSEHHVPTEYRELLKRMQIAVVI
jgi:hypothetical protein